MKSSSFIRYAFTGIIALTLLRCSSTKNNHASISSPLEGVNVPQEPFSINSEEGGTITTKSGSTIVIPANAFTDESGSPYKGSVQIKYREFHNSMEILTSGIPMSYDSAGSTLQFQTAGMFEINARAKDNSELQIAADKEITVNMASFVDGSQYNFYSLDEKHGWNYAGTGKPVKVENPVAKPAVADSQKALIPPVKPREQNEKEKSFNLSFDENEHPELKGFSDVVWQYAGQLSDTAHNPNYNNWVFSYAWEKAELGKYNEQSMDFELLLSSKKKTFKTIVCPVLKGKKLKKALKEFDQKMAQYHKVKTEKENAEKLEDQKGEFLRSFSIKKFGIYNWDCVLSETDRMAINAKFKFDGDIDVPENSLTAYLITGSNRSLVKYEFEDWDKFSFNPNSSNKVVVILPGNRIALFSEQQFKQLDIDKIKNDKSYIFTLHVQKTPVKSMDELSQAIAG